MLRFRVHGPIFVPITTKNAPKPLKTINKKFKGVFGINLTTNHPLGKGYYDGFGRFWELSRVIGSKNDTSNFLKVFSLKTSTKNRAIYAQKQVHPAHMVQQMVTDAFLATNTL